MKTPSSLFLGVAVLMSAVLAVAAKDRANIMMMTASLGMSRERFKTHFHGRKGRRSFYRNRARHGMWTSTIYVQSKGVYQMKSFRGSKWSGQGMKSKKWSAYPAKSMKYRSPKYSSKFMAYMKKPYNGKTMQFKRGNIWKLPQSNMQSSYWRPKQSMAKKYRPQYRPPQWNREKTTRTPRSVPAVVDSGYFRTTPSPVQVPVLRTVATDFSPASFDDPLVLFTIVPSNVALKINLALPEKAMDEQELFIVQGRDLVPGSQCPPPGVGVKTAAGESSHVLSIDDRVDTIVALCSQNVIVAQSYYVFTSVDNLVHIGRQRYKKKVSPPHVQDMLVSFLTRAHM